MRLSKIVKSIYVFSLVSVLYGCAVANIAVDPYVKITLEASRDLNPDINNRPSPIHIKVFHLSSRATFDNLDFDQVFFDAETLLNGELLFHKIYTLQPGESLSEKMVTNRGTHFVAVVAAYRDVDNSGWRFVTEVSDKYYYSHKLLLGENQIIPVSINGKEYVRSDDYRRLGRGDKNVSQVDY